MENFVESTTRLVFQLAIIIISALIVKKYASKYMVPHVIGYIIIGIIIGPYVLGNIPLSSFFPHGVFPINSYGQISESLHKLATIASVILLFYSGLETDVSLFLRYALKGSIIGFGGLIFSFLGGYYVSQLFFPALPLFHPSHLFMGTIATATSVGITTSVLSSKQKVSSPEGVTVLSAAVFDDVFGIIILAVVLGITGINAHESPQTVTLTTILLITIKALGLWIGSMIIGLLFSKKIGRGIKKIFPNPSQITIFVLAIAFFIAALFEISGVSLIIGAYIVGLTFSNTDLSYVIQEKLAPILLLFVPIFFIVSGMQINIGHFLNPEVLLIGLIYSIVCAFSKFLGAGLPSLWLGFNTLGASRIGVGMIPRGEVGLIIGSIGFSAGILSSNLYSAVMMMIVSSSLIAPFILQILLSSNKKGTKTSEKEIMLEKTEIDFEDWKLTRFIVADFLRLMEEEGFFVNKISQYQKNIYHIRKDTMFLTLHALDSGVLTFFSDKQSIPFFKTALYEATGDIAETAQAVKEKVRIIADHTIKTNTNDISSTISLEGIISPFLVNMSIKGETKQEIITELVSLLDKGGYINDTKLFLRDIFEREKTFSTGMQDGLAMPHARSTACNEPKIVIGLKQDGVDFDSLDKKPSHIFILIAIPKNYAHLTLLTHISTLLQHEKFRQNLLQCKKETEIIELFMNKNARLYQK